ncbi:PRC and DUF2382 domain-containing protein [Conexibacter sp. JD483]|uniref:PRC and DUF2382 domain-containing protein n=1 Tax=unclassified Conexibacter TaxID=2627773 RepID=UPI00271A6D24|nr:MULTISPECIES: PRC and DUF2382 domain-containing protein [unclassified Conexibacter]MDO8187957.1 PRC and DUF2382 domain-containing protein [Conexibacter sp. CPCC 205706]MDO8200174.1 PRC and DUF2382 domain-containing protein [Conexibacter sp. CPCC 205762]MDR9369720.1 PRC and DUF2382 domain-containing protein [Conexibacter sp. JD483]
MPTIDQINAWRGEKLYSTDGDKLGTIEEIYLDQQTDQPEWLAVRTGLFGGNVSFVPLAEAAEHDGEVRVPYDKGHVKDAPNAEADGELSQEEEAALYRHYGLSYSEAGSDTGLAAGTSGGGDASRDDERRAVGHDTSGPTTDDAMTRSEEELRVGTREVETGRVRLRKYVVTENVTKTVPVSHEEVRIEREPISDANRDDALDGPGISEEEHEVVLHAEEPVVEKQTVAKERVRLDTETVTGEEQISEEVRRERIETDGADGPRH